RVGRGHAAVDRLLEDDLLDVLDRDSAFLERGPHVHLELFPAAEREQRPDHEHAARAEVQARPRPDLAPGVARDEVLELRGERVRARMGALHVGVAEDLPAHARARPSSFVVVHGVTSPDRKSRTASVKASDCSMFERWAARNETRRAPGMAARSASPSAGVVTGSSLPATTRVGQAMFARLARRSASRSTVQHPMYPSGAHAATIDRITSTAPGSRRRKSAVNQRGSAPSEIGDSPSDRTSRILWSQPSAVPIFAAVFASTSRSTRPRAWTASHIPVRPPRERPHTWARRAPTASRTARASRPSRSSEYGAGETTDRPCPLVS